MLAAFWRDPSPGRDQPILVNKWEMVAVLAEIHEKTLENRPFSQGNLHLEVVFLLNPGREIH
jgi:hypothetical protein